MKLKISIGMEPDNTLFEICSISYVKVGEVSSLEFFGWNPYSKVGHMYMLFGIIIDSTSKTFRRHND